VEPEALNRWLFNEDTVDKVLEQLMRSGEKVVDGDRLGKTIIFAKNHAHAQFIADRFDKNYPHQKGVFARVIDFQVEYAQSLIDDFSIPERAPHFAISVDMLDTGIDIPEIVFMPAWNDCAPLRSMILERRAAFQHSEQHLEESYRRTP
jgi:type I restriction enzyme, R subunit